MFRADEQRRATIESSSFVLEPARRPVGLGRVAAARAVERGDVLERDRGCARSARCGRRPRRSSTRSGRRPGTRRRRARPRPARPCTCWCSPPPAGQSSRRKVPFSDADPAHVAQFPMRRRQPVLRESRPSATRDRPDRAAVRDDEDASVRVRGGDPPSAASTRSASSLVRLASLPAVAVVAPARAASGKRSLDLGARESLATRRRRSRAGRGVDVRPGAPCARRRSRAVSRARRRSLE